jgi:hypothetical protein
MVGILRRKTDTGNRLSFPNLTRLASHPHYTSQNAPGKGRDRYRRFSAGMIVRLWATTSAC